MGGIRKFGDFYESMDGGCFVTGFIGEVVSQNVVSSFFEVDYSNGIHGTIPILSIRPFGSLINIGRTYFMKNVFIPNKRKNGFGPIDYFNVSNQLD